MLFLLILLSLPISLLLVLFYIKTIYLISNKRVDFREFIIDNGYRIGTVALFIVTIIILYFF